MALRLVEAYVPEDLVPNAEEVLREAAAEEVWSEQRGPFGAVVSAVIGAGRTGAALDLLHERLSNVGGFRAMVLPIDAVIPRPHASPSQERRSEAKSAAAVSREEVYASVSDGARLDSTYVALTVLAAIVAAIGLTQNNVAAVIGAMVVAPLLGPNVALALGLTLGDGALFRGAIRTVLVGLLVALATALVMGFGLQPAADIPEIASRTHPDLTDMLLALAAGCAGALAYATGSASYLVGVMVAVALLPPIVASGLLLAQEHLEEALGALLLALANAAAILLAAMATFLWRGMRPRHWWEAERAKRSATRGLAVAIALFVVMAVAVVGAGLLRGS
jgi:uncharacterized hydrophobic protein (TIGR00341 family)